MRMDGVQIRNGHTGIMEWWAIEVLAPKAFNAEYRKAHSGSREVNAIGFCNRDRKTIVIRKTENTDRTGVGVHETLHAVYPFLDEDAILAGEEAVMSVIKTLGDMAEGKE